MTNIQVSLSLKVGFFSGLKMGCSDRPQTLKPAFQVNFSGIVLLKKHRGGPHRHPGNVHLIVYFLL